MYTPEVQTIYPLSKYSLGIKEPRMDKDASLDDHNARMKLNYMDKGMRTTVEGILLVHEHNHPHALVLRVRDTYWRLPGGRLRPGENEIEGLKRKLSSKLAANYPAPQPDWQIGECVATWWRPYFHTGMYPPCPRFVPKECKKLFLVHLSEQEHFTVPKNWQLLVVPFYDLYDNAQTYGVVISAIPHQLSRFHFEMINPLIDRGLHRICEEQN